MATKDWRNTTKDTSNIDRWYKKQDKKKEKQENQNTLPLKSGGKSGPQKCQLFYKYEYYSYFQKFHKFHKRGTIFLLYYTFVMSMTLMMST